MKLSVRSTLGDDQSESSKVFELCSLFSPFFKNMKKTNSRKVRYLDQIQLKASREIMSLFGPGSVKDPTVKRFVS